MGLFFSALKLSPVFFILCVFLTTLNHCSAGHNCRGKTLVPEDSHCPLWFYNETSNHRCSFCKCKDSPVIEKSSYSLLQLGYCMTSDDENINIVPCPYDIAKDRENHLVHYYQSINFSGVTFGEVNNFTCSQLHRTGQYCSQCTNENYGPSVFTLDMACYPCHDTLYSGWFLYFLFELVPLTVFLIIIMFLQVSPTKANMKAFVFHSQLTTSILSLGSESIYSHACNGAEYYIRLIKTCYGFWNLDFFRSALPSFCVDTNLNNLEVMALQYVSVIYPAMLTLSAWLFIELHERGFKPIVLIWRPFKRCLSHFPVTNDPKRTIISFLATLIILSYTKVVFVFANVFKKVTVHEFCKESNPTSVLYLQPDVKYFDQDHAPVAVLSLIMLTLFVVAPTLLLLLYQITFFQDKLNLISVRSNNVQMFVEAFCDCFNDGSKENRDHRLFSTFYLFLRIIMLLIFTKLDSMVKAHVIMAVFHGLAIGILCFFRPYKQNCYTYLDIAFFISFGVASLFSVVATNNHTAPWTYFLFSVIYAIMGLPLLYATIRVLVVLVKWAKATDIRSICHWRRRGYFEIEEYGDESISVDSDREHAHHIENGRRSGQNDSFQSE